MAEIIAILSALSPHLLPRTLRQLTLVVEAMLAMAGRVTMLGLSRWTEKGGSYRTVRRFFKEKIDLAGVALATRQAACGGKQGRVAADGGRGGGGQVRQGDARAGRFFSSIYNKPLPGLCFLNLSLVQAEARESYPLVTERLVRGAVQASAPKAAKAKNPKPGRPKGSANKNRKDVELSPFQTQLQGCIRAALKPAGPDLGIVYFVYDGAPGNNAGLQAVARTGPRLISKLRHDPRLYLPYGGAYAGRGRRRKYGEKLTPETLAEGHLKAEATEKGIRTRVYQAQARHKHFPELLNVAVIVKAHLKTGRTAKVLLFSDGLAPSSEAWIEYYSLRFQIEFNFRDAKQHWGLEDFMNVKAPQVGNFANFSLFRVTFSQVLSAKMEGLDRGSMLDLKTVFRARKYTRRVINSLGKEGEAFLIDDRIFQAAEIGRIHAKAA